MSATFPTTPPRTDFATSSPLTGNVMSAKIVFDRDSGSSKGFGFVEMSTDEEASAAIAGTNGHEFDGRQLRVNEAMDKPRRDRDFGGGRW